MDHLKKAFLCAAALALCACSETSAAGVSGTFTGEGIGMGGEEAPVKVILTLEDSVITDVTVEAEGETDGIGTKAIDSMPAAMVKNNSIEVDGVSGATLTSTAILEAAAQALASAGLKNSDLPH